MLEVALNVLLALLFLCVFNIFPTRELKMPFFHSWVVNLSETQEVGNLSMKSGHLQAVLCIVTIQQSNGCHWATRSRAGAGGEIGGSVGIPYLMRKFKCCVLSTVGWECGRSRRRCLVPHSSARVWEGLEKNLR